MPLLPQFCEQARNYCQRTLRERPYWDVFLFFSDLVGETSILEISLESFSQDFKDPVGNENQSFMACSSE